MPDARPRIRSESADILRERETEKRRSAFLSSDETRQQVGYCGCIHFHWRHERGVGGSSYVYTLRLIGPISCLGACYIRTKVTKCVPVKMTLYFCGWIIKSHSPRYEIGAVCKRSISNSLIIHKIKTKEINTETEFGYVMKHLHKIKPNFISIFPLNTIICLRCYIKHSEECLIYYFSRLSDVLPPLRSWFRALYRTSDRTWEEFVNTLPKVMGFLRVLRFPPAGKVDKMGGGED